jgi:alkylation response protein AidB-like acyl-CoA dehydrogenase
MGGKLGTVFARAAHEVVFSYARSERKLKRLARGAGADAIATAKQKIADLKAQIEACRELSTSLAFD